MIMRVAIFLTYIWVTGIDLAAQRPQKSDCQVLPVFDSDDSSYRGVCLAESHPISYKIDVVPASRELRTKFLDCGYQVQFEGDFSTSPLIPLVSPANLLLNQVDVQMPKIGSMRSGEIQTTRGRCTERNSLPIKSLKLIEGHRWWGIEVDTLTSPGTMNLRIQGSKPYTISVLADTLDRTDSESKRLHVKLIGARSAQTPFIPLHLDPGMMDGGLARTKIRGADVGPISKITIINKAVKNPWVFKMLTIETDDGNVARFQGGQWIGDPYSESMEFLELQFQGNGEIMTRKPSLIHCHTRLTDLIVGDNFEGQEINVICPMGCDDSTVAYIAGLSIHPASSSICAAAVVDGLISSSGGRLMLVAFNGQMLNFDPIVRNILDYPIFSYESRTAEAAWFAVPIDTIDNIVSSLRLVNVFGQFAAKGRLELKRNGVWGTVCLKGQTERFNREAANAVCRDLGYLAGDIVLDESCRQRGLCGSRKTPIFAGGIICTGQENGLGDCTFEQPDTSVCADHDLDVVISCTDHPFTDRPPVGTVRLVDSAGSPATDGIGRLEIFVRNQWGTVCSEGWSLADQSVACRQMGFTSGRPIKYENCRDLMGTDYCGSFSQEIVATWVACEGSESSMKECAMVMKDDIFCSHEEDVLISCEGPGDPSGIGIFLQEKPPDFRTLNLRPLSHLTCNDQLDKFPDLKPGDMFTVRCPRGCSRQAGRVLGNRIYGDSSVICKSAAHSGIPVDSGTTFLVLVAHGQQAYLGTQRHGIDSISGKMSIRAFIPSRFIQDLAPFLNNPNNPAQTEFAGVSRLPDNAITTLSFLALTHRHYTESVMEKKNIIDDPMVVLCNRGPEATLFRGGPHDIVTLNYLPNGERLVTLDSFSIIIRFMTAQGTGRWRSLLSYSECEGFGISLNPDGQIVFEQLCSTNVVYTGIYPKINHWTTLIVSFDKPFRSLVFLEDNEVKLVVAIDFDIQWNGFMRAGKSAILEYEPFYGEISHIAIYSQALYTAQEPFDFDHHLALMCLNTSPPEPVPEYSDQNFKMCVTKCRPASGFPVGTIQRNRKRLGLVQLDCESTLDNMPQFSGGPQTNYSATCTNSCPIISGLPTTFPNDTRTPAIHPGHTPICSVASSLLNSPHDNIYDQTFTISIHSGQTNFPPPPNSDRKQELVFDLRGYSISDLKPIHNLNCTSTAEFLAYRQAPGTTTAVTCPAGCIDPAKTEIYPAKTEIYPAKTEIYPAKTEIYPAFFQVCKAAIDQGYLLNQLPGHVAIKIHSIKPTRDNPPATKGFSFIPHQHGVSCRTIDLKPQIKIPTQSVFVSAPFPNLNHGQTWAFPPNHTTTLKHFNCDSAKVSIDAELVGSAQFTFGPSNQIFITTKQRTISCSCDSSTPAQILPLVSPIFHLEFLADNYGIVNTSLTTSLDSADCPCRSVPNGNKPPQPNRLSVTVNESSQLLVHKFTASPWNSSNLHRPFLKT